VVAECGEMPQSCSNEARSRWGYQFLNTNSTSSKQAIPTQLNTNQVIAGFKATAFI